MQMSLKDLLDGKFVDLRSPRLDKMVLRSEIRFSLFGFAHLTRAEVDALGTESLPPTEAQYWGTGSLCSSNKQLLSPEYKLMGKALFKCREPTTLFDCDTLSTVVAGYDERINLKEPFLRSSELLVLVLKLLMRAMLGVGVGGLQDLHIPHARQVLEEVPMPNEQTQPVV